jgi:hypothetical protein
MAAELLKRLFLSEIQPKLYPGNSWLGRSINDDAFVNNNTVELPHAGTDPNVVIDRVQLPATINKRTDAATNYQLEELTTDPTHIGDSEALIVAYNKRASILDQHAQVQRVKMATRALYKWGAGANSTRIVASTGSNRAAGGSTNGQFSPGGTAVAQTGNRKAFTENDIIGMQKFFYADDIITDIEPVNGVAIITPSQYSDLIKIDNFKRADAYGVSNIPSGVVKRAYGFDFYVRSKVLALNSSDVLLGEGVTGATDSQDCAIFYSPQYVRRAIGAIKTYVNQGEATMYGDILSTMVRFGGAPARNDNKGVYLLFEDN